MFAVFLSNIGCSYLKVSQVKLDTLLCEHDYKTKYILKCSGICVIFFIIISVLFSKNSLRNWLIGSKWILCLDKYIAAELTATSLLLKYTRACIFVLCFCKTEYMMLQKSILICCYLIMMTIKKKKKEFLLWICKTQWRQQTFVVPMYKGNHSDNWRSDLQILCDASCTGDLRNG